MEVHGLAAVFQGKCICAHRDPLPGASVLADADAEFSYGSSLSRRVNEPGHQLRLV